MHYPKKELGRPPEDQSHDGEANKPLRTLVKIAEPGPKPSGKAETSVGQDEGGEGRNPNGIAARG